MGQFEELKIKYPSGFEHAVHVTKDEMGHYILLMASLKMFELGKILLEEPQNLPGCQGLNSLKPAVDIESVLLIIRIKSWRKKSRRILKLQRE